MSMAMTWIKICGMTTSQAVSAALDLKVDAIGFVFAESRRKLTPAAAARLAAPARGRLGCVAVMHHPTQSAVDEVIELFHPDLLQTDREDLQTLHLPAQLQILPVLRTRPIEHELPRRFLFEGPRSGSGIRSDWEAAAQLASRSELVLAGGLDATNVATALLAVRPFGVDVSSGVEERPGIKSPAAMDRFVHAVRAGETVQAVPGTTRR
jgi:phosphoribosylanthranilate isomerase